jgi:hypothetical protein
MPGHAWIQSAFDATAAVNEIRPTNIPRNTNKNWKHNEELTITWSLLVKLKATISTKPSFMLDNIVWHITASMQTQTLQFKSVSMKHCKTSHPL